MAKTRRAEIFDPRVAATFARNTTKFGRRNAVMKIGSFTFLVGVFALFLAACDATTRSISSPPANVKVLDGLVRAYEPECIKQVHKKPSSEQEAFVTALRANDMTVAGFCKCAGQTFFGAYLQKPAPT